MTIAALILALLLEQLHPLNSKGKLHAVLVSYGAFFSQRFDAGKREQGKVAWFAAVLPPVLLAVLLFWSCYGIHPLLAWVFNVAVLYLVMGFRQFSHYFTDIHKAMRAERFDEARSLLAAWRGEPALELNPEEIVRLAIEQALLDAYRNVFGVIVWFVLFSVAGLGGAAGVVLFRLSQFLRNHWSVETEPGSAFRDFSAWIARGMDWLPVRMTAASFAIAGDFEDTAFCWRSQAHSWPEPEQGILLASGAGALGVRLGMPIPVDGGVLDRPELGTGDEADADFMQSAVGLVWRTLVFWLLLLILTGVHLL